MTGRTPEHPPLEGEVGDRSEFNDLLSGMLVLASVEGMSATDFVLNSLGELQKRGLELDGYKLSVLMQHGFGTREELRDRVTGMTDVEFEQTYPNGIGGAVRWYIQPPKPE